VHQGRRPDDEEHISPARGLESVREHVRGKGLTEPDDPRPLETAAFASRGDRGKRRLPILPVPGTARAAEVPEASVKLPDGVRSRETVKAIDVLGDETNANPRFESSASARWPRWENRRRLSGGAVTFPDGAGLGRNLRGCELSVDESDSPSAPRASGPAAETPPGDATTGGAGASRPASRSESKAILQS
jgi:hypothetical protein